MPDFSNILFGVRLPSPLFVRDLQKNKFGFTLVEILVVMMILGASSLVGFMNIVQMKQKQAVINMAHELQVVLDTAHNKSTTVAKNSTEIPSSWGVYIDNRPPDPKNVFYLGPYDTTSDFSPNIPNGSKKTVIPTQLDVFFVPSTSNKNVLIFFDKLTGNTNVYEIKNNGTIGTPVSSDPPFEIVVQGSSWKQTVRVNSIGITELGTVEKI